MYQMTQSVVMHDVPRILYRRGWQSRRCTRSASAQALGGAAAWSCPSLASRCANAATCCVMNHPHLITNFATEAVENDSRLELSVMHDAAQVCLVGQDGSAVLHRVSPVNDPSDTEREAVAICQACSSYMFQSMMA